MCWMKNDIYSPGRGSFYRRRKEQMFHMKHFYGKGKPPAQDGNDGLYLLLGTVQRQGNIGTEQVSINGELEPAALQFH